MGVHFAAVLKQRLRVAYCGSSAGPGLTPSGIAKRVDPQPQQAFEPDPGGYLHLLS